MDMCYVQMVELEGEACMGEAMAKMKADGGEDSLLEIYICFSVLVKSSCKWHLK